MKNVVPYTSPQYWYHTLIVDNFFASRDSFASSNRAVVLAYFSTWWKLRRNISKTVWDMTLWSWTLAPVWNVLKIYKSKLNSTMVENFQNFVKMSCISFESAWSETYRSVESQTWHFFLCCNFFLTSRMASFSPACDMLVNFDL